MTERHHAPPASARLFVVACPTCFGHVAAPVGMAGRAGRCPLCAAAFEVPEPWLAAAPRPPAVARDTQADRPPRPTDPPPPPEQLAPSPAQGTEPAVEPTPEPTPAAESTVESAAAAPPGLVAAPPAATVEPEPQPEPVPAFDFTATHTGSPEPDPRPASLPVDAETFEFREPVKIVGRGRTAIQLHRLTDEERRIRRGRRNLILLLVGASLLLVITLLLGNPARRR